MSTNVDNSKQQAMHAVAFAVQLDGDGKMKEAYQKYLECIQFMSRMLSLDAIQDDMIVTDNTRQFVALCKQCLERIDSLTSELLTKHPVSFSALKPLCPEVPLSDSRPAAPRGQFGIQLQSPTTTATPSSSRSPAVIAGLDNESHLQSLSYNEPSVMELAELQNRKLLATYASRIEKAKLTNKTAAANLSLSIQRRMAENLAIAKQLEITLEKKKQERLKCLLIEAERQFYSQPGMSEEEIEQYRVYVNTLEFEQNKKWLLDVRSNMSTKSRDAEFVRSLIYDVFRSTDHPLTILLQEYQSRAFGLLNEARKKLATCGISVGIVDQLYAGDNCSTCETGNDNMYDRILPSDSGDRQHCVDQTFEVKSAAAAGVHTVTDDCTKDILCERLTEESRVSETGSSSDKYELFYCSESSSVFGEALHGMVGGILSLVNQLQKMFVMTYKELDSRSTTEEVTRILRTTLEEFFFMELWHNLALLYRTTTANKLDLLSTIMKSHSADTPADLNVNPKLTLSDGSTFEVPYLPAVEVLRSVADVNSPTLKKDAIMKCLHTVCECVDSFYSRRAMSSPGIGADELLPILSYVIIKTQCPDIAVECCMLMDFTDERELIGEAGYCLASVQTALSCLLSLRAVT